MRPEDVPETWVDAAATGGEPTPSATWGPIYVPFDLRAAIAAVYPLIAAEVIERCAKVADSAAGAAAILGQGDVRMAEAIATAIRALKDTP